MCTAEQNATASQETAVPVDKAALVTSSSAQAEEYTIVHTGQRRGKASKVAAEDDDEPLIDHTAPLAKNSKKTKRLLKQQGRRQKKASSKVHNFLELPAELLHEILGHLLPSDILRVAEINHATRDFVHEYETSIAKDVMDRRFWVLRRCFPLPVAFANLDEPSRAALLNPSWQDKTKIHRFYTQMKTSDPTKLCSCMSCLLAWNNLSLALDFGHFQWHLNHREKIPLMARGTNPDWNQKLTEEHARIVTKAMSSPLTYAAILEKHLHSIVGTLLRQLRHPPKLPMHRHNKVGAGVPAKTVHPILLYQITERDAAREDDSFLERDGKASLEFPLTRDNYYNTQMLAYVPNRIWKREEQRWMYYAGGAHERDLTWVRERFMPTIAEGQSEGKVQEGWIARFKESVTA